MVRFFAVVVLLGIAAGAANAQQTVAQQTVFNGKIHLKVSLECTQAGEGNMKFMLGNTELARDLDAVIARGNFDVTSGSDTQVNYKAGATGTVEIHVWIPKEATTMTFQGVKGYKLTVRQTHDNNTTIINSELNDGNNRFELPLVKR